MQIENLQIIYFVRQSIDTRPRPSLPLSGHDIVFSVGKRVRSRSEIPVTG